MVDPATNLPPSPGQEPAAVDLSDETARNNLTIAVGAAIRFLFDLESTPAAVAAVAVDVLGKEFDTEADEAPLQAAIERVLAEHGKTIGFHVARRIVAELTPDGEAASEDAA